jgi:hypothetical protein
MAPTRAQRRHVEAEEGSMDSGGADLPEQLLRKVLEALQAVEQCAPQDGGWGACKAPATVRLVCSGWKCRYDALVMRLLLRRATDERAGVLVRRWLAGPQVLKACMVTSVVHSYS